MTYDDLVELALSSTGMSRPRWNSLTEAMKDDAAMNRIMKEEWNLKPRDSDDAVIDYYRKSDIWFINTLQHGWKALLALAHRDISFIPDHLWFQVFMLHLSPGDTVLDYGGGFWNDTARLALSGYRVVQAEIDGPVSKFLSTFAATIQMEDKLAVLPVNSGFPLRETYQGLACFETLEHLLSPRKFTEHLRDHLAPGKAFALSVSFGSPEHAPYHVASNEPLGREGVWFREMQDMGFEHLFSATDCHKQVWRKR